jgi:hypothetical protein
LTRAAGQALGVLVREDGADGLHDGAAGVVFGGDQLDLVALSIFLGFDGGKDLGIGGGEGGHVRLLAMRDEVRRDAAGMRRSRIIILWG